MTVADRFGNALSARGPATVDAYDHAIDVLVRFGDDVVAAWDATDAAEPGPDEANREMTRAVGLPAGSYSGPAFRRLLRTRHVLHVRRSTGSRPDRAMRMGCADCGCTIEAGVRVVVCDAPHCCCAELPIAVDELGYSGTADSDTAPLVQSHPRERVGLRGAKPSVGGAAALGVTAEGGIPER
jgi:hypothetical protein